MGDLFRYSRRPYLTNGRRRMRHFIFIFSLLSVMAFSQIASAALSREVKITKEFDTDEYGCVTKKIVKEVKIARARRPLCRCVADTVSETVDAICRPFRNLQRTKTVTVVIRGCCKTCRRARCQCSECK